MGRLLCVEREVEIMNVPFAQMLAREQQVAQVTVIVSRLSELGFLTDEASSMEAGTMTGLVVGETGIEVSGSDAVRRAIVSKTAKSVETVFSTANALVSKSTPTVRKVGRTTFDVVSRASVFAFEVTRGATARMTGSVSGPACPLCGEATVIRRNRKTGRPFVACTAWESTGCNFVSEISITK